MAVNENNLNSVVFDKPKSIIIDEYEYMYKDELNNNFYTYRCKKRKNCGLVIKISQIELMKYNEDKQYKINYIITGNKQVHTCKDKEKDKGNEQSNTDKAILNNQKIKENKEKKPINLVISSMI